MASGRADDLTVFEEHRRYLQGVGYRMLGSVAEAEDVVQDAFLRWSHAREAEATALRAYLTRIVVRLCLDRLKAARSVREQYVGAWLPEPLLTEAVPPPAGGELLQDLSFALLLLLERLSPLERAAFLLHDVFEMDFAAVADVLESSPAACRQLAARGRQHLQQDRDRPRYQPSAEEGRALTSAFLRATYTGDATALASLLADDARLISDGGGRRPAALNPLQGKDRIVRFFVGIMGKLRADGRDRQMTAREVTLNGLPGALVFDPRGLERAIALELDPDRRVRAIYMVLNPDKLERLARAADPPV
jgi:RNA polymerase sigma-70 factor (ECF subfamily)